VTRAAPLRLLLAVAVALLAAVTVLAFAGYRDPELGAVVGDVGLCR
jgi:hypothetical protein